jgi:hypothetical protein
LYPQLGGELRRDKVQLERSVPLKLDSIQPLNRTTIHGLRAQSIRSLGFQPNGQRFHADMLRDGNRVAAAGYKWFAKVTLLPPDAGRG